MRENMRRGFTLVEMLVVIGIIAILIGASIGGYSHMAKSAERAKAQELVDNVATALTQYFQTEGCWPKRILAQASKDGEMDENIGLILAKKNLLSLTTDSLNSPEYATKLVGVDQFGIVTPWAMAAIKRAGNGASLSTKVNGTKTVRDHRLHFAVDMDGDGIIDNASVGGKAISVRATAIVWCGGKDGEISAYPYGDGGSGGARNSDDVWSWTPGQAKGVK